MNITIKGKSNNSWEKSILDDRYFIDKPEHNSESLFNDRKTLNDESADFRFHARESDGFYNYDGVELIFHADIKANGNYIASLHLSYQEIEMLLSTKIISKYTDKINNLEYEKYDLDNKISNLEDEIEVLKEKVKKFDEIKEKMNE